MYLVFANFKTKQEKLLGLFFTTYVGSDFDGIVNTNDGRKSCTFCGMIFSTQSNAKRHFRNQHTNTERIPCRLCQRTFKNTHSHNEHLRINHGVTQSMLKAQPLVDKS